MMDRFTRMGLDAGKGEDDFGGTEGGEEEGDGRQPRKVQTARPSRCPAPAAQRAKPNAAPKSKPTAPDSLAWLVKNKNDLKVVY